MKQTTILLVDDHEMLRKGLRVLIELEAGLHVIGEAGDGQQAIDQTRLHSPDIVVMDINMPDINGIEATRQIMLDCPETKILALSIHSGKTYVEEMLEAGAAGYLLKESAPKELIAAIQALSDGKGYLSPDVANIVLSRLRQSPGNEKDSSHGDQGTERRLAAKLSKPNLPTGIVYRKKLIEQLEQGRGKKLTLIVAPAGYGKSSLVCDWLNRCEQPNAWLSLDASDNDLHRFLKSMVAALRNLHPETCSHLQDFVDTANLPPVALLVGALFADLEKLPKHFILVLDDMHLVGGKPVHDFLSQVVSHPLRLIHMVLIGRQDPFLPLSTLRAVDDLNEIRAEDLQFSLQEVTKYLEQTLGESVELKIAKTWLKRTNGWVTGLQLATHELGDVGAATQDIAEDNGSDNWRELLTNREYDVLLLLEQRLRDKEIANQLCVSAETVKFHLKNVYNKLKATDRRDAIVKAEQLGLIKSKSE